MSRAQARARRRRRSDGRSGARTRGLAAAEVPISPGLARPRARQPRFLHRPGFSASLNFGFRLLHLRRRDLCSDVASLVQRASSVFSYFSPGCLAPPLPPFLSLPLSPSFPLCLASLLPPFLPSFLLSLLSFPTLALFIFLSISLPFLPPSPRLRGLPFLWSSRVRRLLSLAFTSHDSASPYWHCPDPHPLAESTRPVSTTGPPLFSLHPSGGPRPHRGAPTWEMEKPQFLFHIFITMNPDKTSVNCPFFPPPPPQGYYQEIFFFGCFLSAQWLGFSLLPLR